MDFRQPTDPSVHALSRNCSNSWFDKNLPSAQKRDSTEIKGNFTTAFRVLPVIFPTLPSLSPSPVTITLGNGTELNGLTCLTLINLTRQSYIFHSRKENIFPCDQHCKEAFASFSKFTQAHNLKGCEKGSIGMFVSNERGEHYFSYTCLLPSVPKDTLTV